MHEIFSADMLFAFGGGDGMVRKTGKGGKVFVRVKVRVFFWGGLLVLLYCFTFCFLLIAYCLCSDERARRGVILLECRVMLA